MRGCRKKLLQKLINILSQSVYFQPLCIFPHPFHYRTFLKYFQCYQKNSFYTEKKRVSFHVCVPLLNYLTFKISIVVSGKRTELIQEQASSPYKVGMLSQKPMRFSKTKGRIKPIWSLCNRPWSTMIYILYLLIFQCYRSICNRCSIFMVINQH